LQVLLIAIATIGAIDIGTKHAFAFQTKTTIHRATTTIKDLHLGVAFLISVSITVNQPINTWDLDIAAVYCRFSMKSNLISSPTYSWVAPFIIFVIIVVLTYIATRLEKTCFR